MSKWRLRFVAVAACLLFAAGGRSSAQSDTPSLATVLKRTADYVADFRKQLSGIVAEETYRQTIVNTGRIGGGGMTGVDQRLLRSDFLLVRPPDTDRYVELRDVYEVDGSPVRDRQARLERLLQDPTAGDHIGLIIQESARYNIGRIQRNINTPLMSLSFLDAANQPRFKFTHVEKSRPVFADEKDAAINDTPVFRVSTEMWTIEYDERKRGTIVKSPEGGDRPAHGRFWIDPSSGRVLISELIIDGGGVIATVVVSYQSEPLMGFMVPVEMRESYIRYPQRISGHAEYGKFRPLQ